jgi:hypothetical protein
MLGRFLYVQHPTAKQAVITAIDLLGNFLNVKVACLFLFLELAFFAIFLQPYSN